MSQVRTLVKCILFGATIAGAAVFADEHAPSPCIDETGNHCWDIVNIKDYFSSPNWPNGPSPGTCWNCLVGNWTAVPGSSYASAVWLRTVTLQCYTGVATGTGGNRVCSVNYNDPTTPHTFDEYGGYGECTIPCIQEQ